jgi:hypothetical protein
LFASPKKTPLGVRVKVSSLPKWRAMSRISCWLAESNGTVCTPSMCSAVS